MASSSQTNEVDSVLLEQWRSEQEELKAKLILTDMVRWVWDGEDKKREEGRREAGAGSSAPTPAPKGMFTPIKASGGSRIAETPGDRPQTPLLNYTPPARRRDSHPPTPVEAPAARVRYVGGVDISFFKESDRAVACLTVLELPSLTVVYEAMKDIKMDQPYIPGFLAFREVTPLASLIDELRSKKPDIFPSIILVDGNGTMHPRGFGLASHLGVLAKCATVGVAKKLYAIDGLTRESVDQGFRNAGLSRGGAYELRGESGKLLGLAVKTTKDGVRPVFVSQGHGVSLETARKIVVLCSKHKIPEPVRQADLRSRQRVRDILAGAETGAQTSAQTTSAAGGFSSVGLAIALAAAAATGFWLWSSSREQGRASSGGASGGKR